MEMDGHGTSANFFAQNSSKVSPYRWRNRPPPPARGHRRTDWIGVPSGMNFEVKVCIGGEMDILEADFPGLGSSMTFVVYVHRYLRCGFSMASTANIPYFPESDHRLVQSLQHLSDRELVSLFQQHPGAGRYFTAIFCRYSPMVYSLIRHSARSPVQADYLFALTWRHILHELNGLLCPAATEDNQKPFTLQNWLINVTALCINQAVIPEVETIHYSLAQASPPLWCYLEQALDRLPPLERLVLVMALTFRWSETRIVAYLRAEGETLSAADVRQTLDQAYRRLGEILPEDIRIIYLNYQPPQEAAVAEGNPLDEDLLAGVFDWPDTVATRLAQAVPTPQS